jgi:hypothetical protein
MNNFRRSLHGGRSDGGKSPLQPAKRPRSPGADGLDQIAVVRDAHRTADHRDDDRHRLVGQTATLDFRGKTIEVDLINLSGGGAMVHGPFAPEMWEKVVLTLGEHGRVECAVRWIRGDRIGLEFAHETQILGDPAARDAMLLDALSNSFPDLVGARPPAAAPAEASPAAPAPAPVDAARRAEPRHPMIWSGHIHFNHDSTPVRLRNVSPHGALVESPLCYPAGAEVYLDLGDAGRMFATVCWARGDQVGLGFAHPFDIAGLARARPTIAPQRWATPPYLRDDQGDASPWSSDWGRLSLDELKNSLEGFLKH